MLRIHFGVKNVRILFIDVNFKSGSTGKIVFDLKGGLENEGHEVFACYGRGPIFSDNKVARFSTKAEVYFHAFMTRITGLTGIYSFFSTRKLLSLIKKFEPDIVHIHELDGYFVNIGPIINYLKRKQIKTIWTFHCEFMYTGRCGYSYECNRWKEHCGNCPKLSEYPATYFFDFSRFMQNQKKRWFESFESLKIVTPSNWLAERVKESFLRDKPVYVINNGIETETVFCPRTYKQLSTKLDLDNDKVLLAVAPDIMQERKGGQWVMKLARRFQQENVKVIMVGVTDDTIDKPENVILIKKTENQTELARYYSMADVFVICSPMENFPTVCLESLACGTPICGFDVGGTRETAPPDLGYFVPYGDIDALESEVRKRLERGKQSEECVTYAKEHYSKERMYQEYKKLYLSE